MSGLRDPQIKLFGKTIELPDTSASGVAIGPVSVRCGESETEEQSSLKEPPSSSGSMLEDCNLTADKDQESNKGILWILRRKVDVCDHQNFVCVEEADLKHEEDHVQHLSSNDSKDPNTSKTEEDDQNETSDSQDKTLKKPDKILPCPRCNSVDTKFCYFNNYNVNQPRHFCKNCQRYWTAGGSMRNVPVGAGRRKNKSTSSSSSSVLSQFRHLAVPEALNHNGTILAFGSDVPLCESMATVLNIADKTAKHGSRNGFHKPEGLVISVPGTDNGAQYSSGSSGKATGSNDDTGQPGLTHTAQNCHPFPTQVPCYPGASWPYPWNPVQWNSLVSQAAFRPGNFPIPYYSTPPPPPYWGCSLPGAWNVPWMISPTSAQSHFQSPSSCSGPNSPTLGKHSRDDSCLKPDSSAKEDESVKERSDSEEKSLWVPKTLRIDDPEEAAKSSIWATLGIKNDRASDSINSNGLFKGFQGRQQTKGDEKTRICDSSTVLQANPAALSRSLRFHENS